MPGIPPELNTRLYEILSRCGPFDSDRDLQAVFVDGRIMAWKDKVPGSDTREKRIRGLIEALHDQYNSEGLNVLSLFLSILIDGHNPGNACRSELAQLAREVEGKLPVPSSETLIYWDRAIQQYKRTVAERYNTIQIFGQPKPVALSGVYTDLSLLDRPSAFRRFDIQKLERDPDLLKDAMRISGEDIIQSTNLHRLFILGKPGAGKTTFLKHVAQHLATQDNGNRVPIFVSLKVWADSGQKLLPYITEKFEVCGVPDAARYVLYLFKKTDQAMILFDGLDETRQEDNQRRITVAALQSFAERFPHTSVLITCRVAASDYTFQNFTYLEVADFTPDQIASFVRKWFHTYPNKGEAFLEQLVQEQHRGLRELARQPLLLAMLCLTFNDSLTFPVRRVELYHDALDALLRKWDSSRNIRRDEVYKGLSIGRKQQLFEHLAAQAFKQGIYFLPQEQLEKDITNYLCQLPRSEVTESADVDGESVLKAIEAHHGILVERAYRIHSFAHLTFQEYYTAMYFVESAASDPDIIPRLLAHAHEDRWCEVILLATSKLSNADTFFEHFVDVLDAYVRDEPRLLAFLTWAEHRASKVSLSPERSFDHRAFYIWLGINTYGVLCLAHTRAHLHNLANDLARGHDGDLNRAYELALANDDDDDYYEHASNVESDRALDLALSNVHTGDLDRARALAFTLTRACNYPIGHASNLASSLINPHAFISAGDFVIDLSQTLERNLNLANELVSDLYDVSVTASARARAHASVISKNLVSNLTTDLARILANICSIAQEVGLSEFYSALSSLKTPCANASANTWYAFTEQLRKLLIKNSSVGHDWVFSVEEYEILGYYLIAAEVFVQCLDLAAVSNRECIEGRLLCPPSPKGIGDRIKRWWAKH